MESVIVEEVLKNKELPKLSVILPVFNGEKYVERTISNLLKSTYQNIELIIIDDGSKDKSLEICKRYSNLDTRVKVYHKENEGVALARNYGLKYATGEYVGFCDQDDEISNKMYQQMMERILMDGSNAALCGTYRKKQNGESVVFEKFRDKIYDKNDIEEKLLLPMLFKGFAEYNNKEINIYTSIWKCIISKRLIDEKNFQFYGFINYEDDLVMLIQLFLNADKISTLSNVLYFWNTNSSSETYQCRGRYNANLEIKQQNLLNYITKELLNYGISDSIVNKLKYVMHCRNVLLLIDNLVLIKDINFSKKIKIIRKNKSVLFIQSDKYAVKSEKGFIRNCIIIQLVRKKFFICSYVFNKYINCIRYWVEKNPLMERLERKMKG